MEPSTEARTEAFRILQRHSECLMDDTPLQDFIDDIATAIDRAGKEKEIHRCGP